MAVFLILSCLALLAYGISVPPQVCFEPFNWGDCGKPPVHVLYYYKSGSRCEVGVWRGCFPSLNMFKNEYECMNTCVYVARAGPEDYHMMAGVPVIDDLSPEISAADAVFPTDQNVTKDQPIDPKPVDKESKEPQQPEIDANTDSQGVDATVVSPVDATKISKIDAVDPTTADTIDPTATDDIDPTAADAIDPTTADSIDPTT